MSIVRYERADAARLAAAYNDALAGVPHCYPVSTEELSDALDVAAGEAEASAPLSARGPHPRVPLRAGAAWLAEEGGDVTGLIHVAVAPDDDGEGAGAGREVGAIRAFWFRRGARAAGQALLDAATEHLCAEGVARLDAYRYEHRLPFYHLEHAALSWRLEHVHALLGMNGFVRREGELVLDLPDCVVADPGAPPLAVEIVLEWTASRGGRPGLIARAIERDEVVGMCVCTSAGDYAAAAEAEDWIYTAWLATAERLRCRGLGRYLLTLALREARDVGYRHAALCCLEHNHRALMLYTGLGYRAVDWTWAWSRDLETPVSPGTQPTG